MVRALFYGLFLTLLGTTFISCHKNASIQENEPKLLEVRPIPQPENKPEIQIVEQADITAKNREDFSFANSQEQEDSLDIIVEIIEQWDDANNYFTHVNFINTTDRDITKNIYVLHYDRLGRIAESRSLTTYFRANSHFIQLFVFSKHSNQTRWIIKVR